MGQAALEMAQFLILDKQAEVLFWDNFRQRVFSHECLAWAVSQMKGKCLCF